MLRLHAEDPPRLASSRTRDDAIDILRGLALVSMTTGHVARALGSRSGIETIIHLPLFVDGAHGFVFLSGVSVALADTARLERGESVASRVKWLASRSLVIYLWHIVITLAVLAIFSATDFPPFVAERPFDTDLIVDVLTFRMLVALLDVLPLYVFFVALSPLALLWRGKFSQIAVALVSLSVYVVSQFQPDEMAFLNAGSADSVWVYGSWQILYFGGLLCGLNWWRLRDFLFSDRGRSVLVVLGFLAALSIVILRTILALGSRFVENSADWIERIEHVFLPGRPQLPLGQLLIVVSFGVVAYVATVHLGERLKDVLGVIRRMGARSLRVYIGSGVLVVIASFAHGTLGLVAD